jgi:hypothetical protein
LLNLFKEPTRPSLKVFEFAPPSGLPEVIAPRVIDPEKMDSIRKFWKYLRPNAKPYWNGKNLIR